MSNLARRSGSEVSEATMSASSVWRYSLVIALSSFVRAACATSAVDDTANGECADAPCKGDAGAKSDARPPGKDSGGPPTLEEDGSPPDDEDATTPDPDPDPDPEDSSVTTGDWVDMTNNANACH